MSLVPGLEVSVYLDSMQNCDLKKGWYWALTTLGTRHICLALGTKAVADGDLQLLKSLDPQVSQELRAEKRTVTSKGFRWNAA